MAKNRTRSTEMRRLRGFMHCRRFGLFGQSFKTFLDCLTRFMVFGGIVGNATGTAPIRFGCSNAFAPTGSFIALIVKGYAPSLNSTGP